MGVFMVFDTIAKILTPERLFYGCVASVGIPLFLYYVNHRLSIKRDKLNAKRNAAIVFRSVLLSELREVYPEPVNWPGNVDAFFRGAFPRIQSAVAQYKVFLSPSEQLKFDESWVDYKNAYGREIDIQCYHHYMAFGDNPEYKEILKKNVDALLSFANNV